MLGSRSALIGTPPQMKFVAKYQCIEADQGGVPLRCWSTSYGNRLLVRRPKMSDLLDRASPYGNGAQ
jgi:hypothetical protein